MYFLGEGIQSMRVPRYIDIKGVQYKVLKVDNFKAKNCYGDIDFRKKVIRVHKNKYTKSAFLHECLHGVLYETGIKHLDHDFEDTMVESISDFFV